MTYFKKQHQLRQKNNLIVLVLLQLKLFFLRALKNTFHHISTVHNLWLTFNMTQTGQKKTCPNYLHFSTFLTQFFHHSRKSTLALARTIVSIFLACLAARRAKICLHNSFLIWQSVDTVETTQYEKVLFWKVEIFMVFL